MVPTVIKVLEDGQTNIWMGYNDIDMDVVYVGHVAKAEVQAALGLLRCHVDPTAPRIDGQAFNITDDEVSRPWTFFRKYWLLAGDKTPLNRVWKIPPPLVMLMAHVAEVSAFLIGYFILISLHRFGKIFPLIHGPKSPSYSPSFCISIP